MQNPIEYVKETNQELRKVSWPTRKQAIIYTVVVIAISLVVAGFLGFFDYIFTLILELFIL